MQKLVSAAALALTASLAAPATAASFFEGFDGTGGAGSAWETANWHNGDIFGCGFAYSEVWRTGWGALQLNVNGSTRKCGEVRTWQSFTYGKFVTRSSKYHAHDEAAECKAGDTVLIEECRPISKTKAWRVIKLVEKAKQI